MTADIVTDSASCRNYNASSESWFGGFKNERAHGESFETRDEMKAMAFEYIEPETAALDAGLPVADAIFGSMAQSATTGKTGSMKPISWETKNRGKVSDLFVGKTQVNIHGFLCTGIAMGKL